MCVSECVSPFKSIDTNRKKKKKKISNQRKFATLDYYPPSTRCLDISIPLRFAVNSFFSLFIYLFHSACVIPSERFDYGYSVAAGVADKSR